MQQPFRRIKRSFTAGEVSPFLEGRTSAKTFLNGCKTLKNMVVLPEGPVTRRPGFEFFADLGGFEVRPSLMFFAGTDGCQYILFIHYSTGLPPKLYALTVHEPSGLAPAGTIYEIGVIDNVNLTSYVVYGDEIYIAAPRVELLVVSYGGFESWSLTKPTLIGAPFSSTYGYPYFVFFHQQRLGLARTDTRPQGVWLSAVNDFYNFDITLTDPDKAVSFQLDSDINSKIQWVSPDRSLFIGTDDDEWTVRGGGTSQLITPTSVLAQRHTNIGSVQLKALRIAHTTLFVEQLGRAVFELLYDYYADSYTVQDLIILSKHLTSQYKIKSWAYQQVPHRLIWAVREDGQLLTLTYQREHKVLGWSRHEVKDVNGNILEFSEVINGEWTAYAEEHVIWVLDSLRRLYTLAPWNYSSPYWLGAYREGINWVFMDDSERHNLFGATAVSVNHYIDGDEVEVLTDLGVHNKVTVSGGQIVLDYPCNFVILGKSVEAEVRPISIDIETQEGTTIGAIQQVVELDLLLYETQSLTLTRYNENAEVAQQEELFFTPPSNIEFPNFFSGHYIYSFPEGYNYKTDYSIKQTNPLPFTLIGIVETVKVL